MAGVTPEDVQKVIEGYNRIQQAIIYGNKFVLETEQKSGDDYRMIWSNRISVNRAETNE